MLWACRTVDSLRGARVQDSRIRRVLERENIEQWIIGDALDWQGANPPMPPSYVPQS